MCVPFDTNNAVFTFLFVKFLLVNKMLFFFGKIKFRHDQTRKKIFGKKKLRNKNFKNIFKKKIQKKLKWPLRDS